MSTPDERRPRFRGRAKRSYDRLIHALRSDDPLFHGLRGPRRPETMCERSEMALAPYRQQTFICRAPPYIRGKRGTDFEPKWVSIGPYYHGQENLEPMEKWKLGCMSDLLKMRPVGASNIDDVPVDQFMEFEESARGPYAEKLDHSGVDFVRMLVLDSCFIIRIVLSLPQGMQETMETMVFQGVHIKEVRSDLLLLENQIPLFFIKKVYQWLFPHSIPLTNVPKLSDFQTILENFICFDMPWRRNLHRQSWEAAHLLDIYWRCSWKSRSHHCELKQPSSADIHLPINAPRVTANATVLHKIAGIKFKKLKDERHVCGLDVTFSNGIMWMPCLKIDSSQTTLLVNLIAFENSTLPSCKRTFSSYLILMKTLIDSEEDVRFLQQRGVIYNTLSSHMAATFFNDIGNFCFIEYHDNFFFDLFREVQKYYDSRWNHRWASLRDNYFSNPWVAISVVAGGTMLILQALQTFYTIYDHYNPKH